MNRKEIYNDMEENNPDMLSSLLICREIFGKGTRLESYDGKSCVLSRVEKEARTTATSKL